MRKNVRLCVTAVVCLLFVTVAVFSLWAYGDSQRVSSLGETEYSERLQVNGSSASADTVVAALDALSDAYDVSIMRVVASLGDDGGQETVYAGAFSWDTFPVDQLCLLSGSVPSDGEGFLASWETGEPDQTGLMYSFAGSSRVSVRPLGEAVSDSAGETTSDSASEGSSASTAVAQASAAPALSGPDGIYLVTSTRPYDADAVNQALSQLFGLSVDELLSVRTTHVSAPSVVMYASVAIAVVSGCAYLLFVVSAPVSDAKRIGVCKMLGWSGGATWSSVAVPVLASQACAAVLADALLLLLASPVGWDFVAALVAAQAVVVLLTQAMGALALLVIMRIPVASMLGNGVSLRVPLAASVSLKLLVVAGIVVVMAGMSGTFDDVAEQCRSVALWNREGGSYYVFASSALTDEQLRSVFSGDTSYSDKFASLYEMLNDEYGGCYVTAGESVPLEQGAEASYRVLSSASGDASATGGAVDPVSVSATGAADPVSASATGTTDPAAAGRATSREWTEMDVNANYLDGIDLTDEAGNPIRIDESDARRVVLLPSTMPEEDRRTVLSRVAYNLDTMYQAESVRWGDAASTWDGGLDVMVYQGGRELFSFSRSVGEDTGYLVEDPFFLVLTKANASNMERSSLALTGTSARMLLPFDDGEAQHLEGWLAENGFADDEIALAPLSDAFSEETARMLSSMGLLAAVVGLVLALDAGTSWLLASLLVMSHGRRYAVERLLGWGWPARHERGLRIVGAVATLAAAAMLVLGCGAVAMVVGAACLGVDALVLMMVLRRSEGRSVMALVKGA